MSAMLVDNDNDNNNNSEFKMFTTINSVVIIR